MLNVVCHCPSYMHIHLYILLVFINTSYASVSFKYTLLLLYTSYTSTSYIYTTHTPTTVPQIISACSSPPSWPTPTTRPRSWVRR